VYARVRSTAAESFKGCMSQLELQGKEMSGRRAHTPVGLMSTSLLLLVSVEPVTGSQYRPSVSPSLTGVNLTCEGCIKSCSVRHIADTAVT